MRQTLPLAHSGAVFGRGLSELDIHDQLEEAEQTAV